MSKELIMKKQHQKKNNYAPRKIKLTPKKEKPLTAIKRPVYRENKIQEDNIELKPWHVFDP